MGYLQKVKWGLKLNMNLVLEPKEFWSVLCWYLSIGNTASAYSPLKERKERLRGVVKNCIGRKDKYCAGTPPSLCSEWC